MDQSSQPVQGPDVELVFSQRGGLEKTKFGAKEFSAKIDDIKKWFNGYEIDTIELWIQGAAKEGAVTKLFISFEGSGGIKVTLKPRH